MFTPIHTFSGFSVDDLTAAKEFYIDTLGLQEADNHMGLELKLPGSNVFIYEKEHHVPATFTVLNFVVEDIDTAHDALAEQGIIFERYGLGDGAVQDDKGILRGLEVNMGPNIAWFKDPAGNVLSLIQNK